MRQKDFWSGFAVGAGAALGGLWAAGFVGRGGMSRVVRLEKSVQIGRPVHEVFDAWERIERIPYYCRYITHVRESGNYSDWTANIDGTVFHWTAEITQIIPNQAIGWKSVRGAKHSGRVTFSPLGDQTLVHVQMNYAPPSPLLRPLLGAVSGNIESYLEQALRDFKSELEGRAREVELAPGLANTGTDRSGDRFNNVKTGNFGAPSRPAPQQGQATGTEGVSTNPNANPTYGTPRDTTIEYTRPPEGKY